MIDFGLMPIANGFLSPENVEGEDWFPLAVVVCSRCTMVQLRDVIPPERLFPADYVFHSSTSAGMASHFEEFAHALLREVSGRNDAFIVEIGSNDGILLRHVAAAGIRHVGVEPAGRVADVARSRGVNTESRFFDSAVAAELRAEHGAAHVIVSANVICHIAAIHEVAAGVAHLLHPEGIFVFEDPYLGDILELASFDQMYDEHVFYFSLASVQYLFAQYGLEVVDVMRQRVHGGSMRYFLAHAGSRAASDRVAEMRAREEELKLGSAATYDTFRARVAAKREALRSLLERLRSEGRRVVGYAATSKSTTTIVYCGLTQEHLEFICDTTPAKQGKVSPGAHIPVRPHQAFVADYPDYAVLFAWNHLTEVLAKEQDFTQGGGRFIAYVPEVRTLDATS
ncbi:MAG: SAM-dependent methyltransferase [Gemmatimonadetes bacterium]|nr:SAM-dependent methyltransferase [Gemmatimonadota bacterium]